MIEKGVTKTKVVFDRIARHFGHTKEFNSEAARAYGGCVHYLGEGYWRAVEVIDDDTGNTIGFSLVNPDRKPEQIQIVEQAIAIIEHLTYRP